jgi:hypothetical protein
MGTQGTGFTARQSLHRAANWQTQESTYGIESLSVSRDGPNLAH